MLCSLQWHLSFLSCVRGVKMLTRSVLVLILVSGGKHFFLISIADREFQKYIKRRRFIVYIFLKLSRLNIAARERTSFCAIGNKFNWTEDTHLLLLGRLFAILSRN
jgi:hypothetical protein